MFGTGISGRRWLRPAGVAASVIGVVSIVGALMLAPASMAAESRSATAALVELTIDDASPVGVPPFSGRYGTADTPDLTLPSDIDEGDFSDPDGVLQYITVHGTEVAETSWDAGSTQLTARSNATGFALDYNGVTDFATAGSIDSYARCLDNGGALAYARGDGSAAYVLEQAVPEGVPTTIDVTGAQLNMPDVDSGTLTVTVTRVENAVNTPTEVSAEAYVKVVIEGDLKDASGATLYQGQLVDMTVGHVKVTCTPQIAPSSSSASGTTTSSSPSEDPSSSSESPTGPTSTSDSPSPTSESPTSGTPTSESPSESPTSGTPTSESPSESPTSASPTSESPSESPSSESPSETPSTTDPKTVTPSESPTSTSESPTGTTDTATSPDGGSPSTGEPDSGPDGGGSDDGGGSGPFLPTTGGSGGTILTGLVLGLSALLFGVVLLNLAARRSRG